MATDPSPDTQPVQPGDTGRIPLLAFAIMLLVAWAILLFASAGSLPAASGAMMILMTDGIMAALMLIAAGGFGWLIYRRFAGRDVPPALGLATAAGLGLWLLGTAVMVVGSLVPGSLTPWVWWPVVGVGVLLAVVQAYRPLGRMTLPGRLGGANLAFVFAAGAAGLWLAGVTMPPGAIGNLTADSYDVLEYHLQLPREFHLAGQVSTLEHNVYSHYPLGVEMLGLLGMCLRGGPYAGMYLAKMAGALFIIPAVAAVFAALRGEDAFRARAASALLVTAPWVIYLSSVAMSEPAQIGYLALGLLWLRQWLADRQWASALWIGAMAGAACATKYLAVGLVAVPLGATMLVLATVLRRPRGLAQAALAAAIGLVLFAPWLVRNAAATGNPVFPLATSVFGRGHWPEESAERWRAGHAAEMHPPVPRPPGWQPPERTFGRGERLLAWLIGGMRPYLTQPPLSPAWLSLILAVAAVAAMVLRPGSSRAWEWATLGVLVVQVAVWALFTRNMPPRFISVAVVPLALLAAGGLARLSRVERMPVTGQTGGGGRWGLAPAGLLLAATALLQLMSARAYLQTDMIESGTSGLNAQPAEVIRTASGFDKHPPDALLGEAKAFYIDPLPLYATVFDVHPLAEDFAAADTPAALARRLRDRQVGTLLVNWPEIRRLTMTYGWPTALPPERLAALAARWPTLEEHRPPPAKEGEPPPPPIITILAVPAPQPPPATTTTAP
jgi:hypothetical protein